MQYRSDILALYGELFRDAQNVFEKNAAPAWLGRAGAALRNFFMKSPLRQATEELTARSGASVAATAARPAATAARRVPSGSWSAVPTSSATPAAESAAARVSGKGYTAPAAAPAAPAAPAAAAPEMGPTAREGLQGALEKIKQTEGRARNYGIAAGIGIPAALGGGYLLGRPSQEELDAETRKRNLAFGAGAATGLTAPFVIRGLGQLANSAYGGGQGLMPGGYPSLVPGQGY